MRKLETWPETIGRGLFVGAMTGASGVIGYFFLLACIEPLRSGSVKLPANEWVYIAGGLYLVFIIFACAFVLWLLGIVFFGLGPWWLLHRLGFRGWLSAAVLGFAVPSLVWSFINGNRWELTSYAIGALGILVAEAIWYSSYRYGAGADEIRTS
jgi:hypothetical protein